MDNTCVILLTILLDSLRYILACSLASPKSKFVGMQAYAGSSPVITTIQVASMPLSLVSTKALLISHSTHSVKLSFFQKAPIVKLVCIKDCEEWGRGVYTQDKMNIQAKAPSPLLSQSSVQKWEPYFRELKVYIFVFIYTCMVCVYYILPYNISQTINDSTLAFVC